MLKVEKGTDNSVEFATGNYKKTLWRLAIPAIIAMTVNSIYTLVDRIFVGHYVGTEGLAAMKYAQIVVAFTTGAAMLVSTGASTIYSIKFGKGEHDEMQQIHGTATTLAWIVGIVFALLTFFVGPTVAVWFSDGAQGGEYAGDYLRIFAISIPFYVVGTLHGSMLRAKGYAKIITISAFVSQGFNILTDYITMEFFDMGMKGAALATAVAQTLLFVIAFIAITFKYKDIKVKPKFRKIKKSVLSKIFKIGVSPLSSQLTMIVTMSISIILMIKIGGEELIAVSAMASSVVMFTLLPSFGISHGATPLLGFNFGARNFERVWSVFKYKFMIMTVYFGTLTIIVMGFPEPFIRLFSVEVTEESIFILRATMSSLMLLPWIFGFSGLYQSMGQPKKSAMVMLGRALFAIPAMLLFSLFDSPKYYFLYLPAVDVFLALIFTPMFLRDRKKLLNGQF